ncbi:MAG: hypothetical protein J5608_00710 [Alphaproteobacteria bacterium]|nr:hypothetical protein [Alphaproteobacteria bacterium]
MIQKLAIFAVGLMALPGIAGAACSRINLTKCLDSACAINMGANPAARCQYCGTPEAGEPATSAMKSVTAGTASKNSISAKDLKKAPTDPGERYVWATKLCLEKITGCTTEDVEETYDPLIEKSCTAAGISQDMAALQKKSTKTKSESACRNEINACVVSEKKCGADFSKCKTNELFDQALASCTTQSTGCTAFSKTIRESIAKTRADTISTAASNVQAIVAAHIKRRMTKITSINQGCSGNTNYESCVAEACKNNTPNNCANPDEQKIANYLCQFHKTACERVKNMSTAEMQKDLDKLMEEASNELNL